MKAPGIWVATAGVILPALALSPQSGGTVSGTVSAVGARTSGAVVYLVSADRPDVPPPGEPTLVDQVNLRFVPQVLAVTPGTTVEFQNSDPILHNVFSPQQSGAFDLGRYPRTERRSHLFTNLGAYVILCHVHPEMVAHVVVVPTAHHAVLDEDGHFRIENVPAGRYIVRTWHRFLTAREREVTVPTDGSVRLQLTLEPAGRAPAGKSGP